MNRWVPVAISVLTLALLFILALLFPWYTISFSSEGEITATKYNLPVGSGHAEAQEDYYLYKQVNSTSGQVEYRGDVLYEWSSSDTNNYVSQKEYKNMFFVQLAIVIMEAVAFISLIVLLALGALGKVKKPTLLAVTGVFMLLLITGSLYLLLALPTAISSDPQAHLPGSAREKLTDSNSAFAPYGVDNATVNETVNGVMAVEDTGGVYGSDSGHYETDINGGDFSSDSKLSWYPSVGWFAHVLMALLALAMLFLIIRLDLKPANAKTQSDSPDAI